MDCTDNFLHENHSNKFVEHEVKKNLRCGHDYTIKWMEELFGITEHTLRFYTDKGLLPCERDGGNRRIFNEESVNWMQGIKCLKG